MKNKLFYLLLGLNLVLLSYTNKQKTDLSIPINKNSFYTVKQKVDTAIITGKVNINWSKTIKLKSGAISLIDSWTNRLALGDSLINLNDDGSFKIKLAITKSDFYRLSHENNEIQVFLSLNDSLHIDFNV